MTIQARFERFHAANPEVYDLLVRFAREMKAAGHTQAGIKMVWERVRWELVITTVDSSSPFKLNNNYTSRYARMIMAHECDLVDFFKVREIRAA